MAREPQIVDGLEEELPGEETEIEDGDEGQDGVNEDDAEGDEREAAEEGDDETQGRQGQVAPRSRKGVGDIRREAREAKEESARLKQRLDDLERQAQQRQSAPDPELERQRLELMTPDEKVEYRFNKAQEANQRTLAQMQVQMWDTNDRSAFAQVVSSNPVAAKYAGEVERLFKQEMQAGRAVSRETVLAYVVGQSVLKRAPAAAGKQRQQGRRRIEEQRGSGANGRSDQPAGRRGEKSLEDRLSDVII